MLTARAHGSTLEIVCPFLLVFSLSKRHQTFLLLTNSLACKRILPGKNGKNFISLLR
jgi:hypothetical protein